MRIALPSPGLNLACDPRIADSHEVFGFELESPSELKEVTWFVDGRPVAHYTGDSRRHLWPLEPGCHTVRARALRIGANILDETDDVEFFVR